MNDRTNIRDLENELRDYINEARDIYEEKVVEDPTVFAFNVFDEIIDVVNSYNISSGMGGNTNTLMEIRIHFNNINSYMIMFRFYMVVYYEDTGELERISSNTYLEFICGRRIENGRNIYRGKLLRSFVDENDVVHREEEDISDHLNEVHAPQPQQSLLEYLYQTRPEIFENLDFTKDWRDDPH